VITDEEAIRLLELFDPARVDDAAPVLEPAEYREALHTRTVPLTLIDHQPMPTEPASRRRWPILIAAAAAIVVAITLVVIRDDDATPADQPSPTVSVPPTTPARALPRNQRWLEPGTYYVNEVSGTFTPRIFATFGAGWWTGSQFSGWFLSKWNVPMDLDEFREMPMDEMNQSMIGGMRFSQPAAVFLDACHSNDPSYHRGPVTTLDGLVAALSEQRGWVDVTAPTDIFIDGYAGKAFQRTAPADMSDCDIFPWSPRVRGVQYEHPVFVSWVVSEADRFSGSGPYEPGQIETVWVIDIDGTIVVITTTPLPEPSAGAPADFAADVLDSIRIERPEAISCCGA
jgi:hypothetical protein